MRVWRILHARHAADPLSGEGARLFGGRWNHRGMPLVYCAETLSLAALEVLAHADVDDLPSDMKKVCIEVPDDLPKRVITITELPVGWDAASAPEALKDLGGRWIDEAKEALLIVPSAIIHEERVVLLNPAHSDIAKIKVASIQPFIFDTRLRK